MRRSATQPDRPDPLTATAPTQVWSGDITYLATTGRGAFCYRYLILDLYSRQIVGWEVYPEASAAHAAEVFQRAHRRAAVGVADRVLHSDHGAPMQGATLLATLKGSPALPEKPCAALPPARSWVATFVAGYHETHRHRALKCVTPDHRHRGEDRDLLAQRDALYQAAKAENPERWSGPTRNGEPPARVLLNPGQPRPRQDQTEEPAP